MDNTTSQWLPQGFNGVVINKPHLETSSSKAAEINSQLQQVEKREIRAKKEQPLNCPRCNSLNTKFCYYNNYSLSQPRHYCKTCKRYWTQGGSLRNIPVGGASRKNRRSSSSSSSKQIMIPPSSNNSLFIHGGSVDQSQNPSLSLSSSSYLNLPMISSGFSTNSMISSVFSIQEPKPTLNYFTEIDQNGVHLHRQGMAATAKFDGFLFDQIGRGEGDHHRSIGGEGDHHRSIGFGLNNGMFGGGSSWQL